jgi:3-methyladenine DNA glycosylase AlkD
MLLGPARNAGHRELSNMGKLLQTKAKRSSAPATKKPIKPVATRTAAKKRAAKPTLRQLNRWLTANQEQILQKAKENCLRLTGRETL